MNDQNIQELIIVDNNSSNYDEIKKFISQISIESKKIIRIPKNRGSAYGYKVGIQKAYENMKCQFIWLLDDDNEPKNNAMNELNLLWNRIKIENKKSRLCLVSNRESREIENLRFIVPFFPINRFIIRRSKDFSIVPMTHYGGMFFHKKLIDMIGLPNEKFFVYNDDFDFSYRITKLGGLILSTKKSKLIDLDMSEVKTKENSKLWKPRLLEKLYTFIKRSTSFNLRMYYSFRNKIIFESQNLVKFKFVYYFNAILFTVFFSWVCILFLEFQVLRFFILGITDGLMGNLDRFN